MTLRIKQEQDQLVSSGHLRPKQCDHLVGSTKAKTRNFNLLPKIHKDSSTWLVPHEVNPGRPIVSDSETYSLSQSIDTYLRPLVTRHNSYKYMVDFLDKVAAGDILFTIAPKLR